MLISLEYSGKIYDIINMLESSFLNYKKNITTNRYWIQSTFGIIESIFSINFIYWLSIGFYTSLFGFLSMNNILIFFLSLIAGVGKLLLIYKFYKIKLLYSYAFILCLLIYGTPISVYNVGSSLRYLIPLYLLFLYSWILLNKTTKES